MEAIRENGITAITVINLSYDNNKADKIIKILDGKTFMKFRCYSCATGGSFDVMAETDYDGTVEEIQGMIMMCLAYELLGN